MLDKNDQIRDDAISWPDLCKVIKVANIDGLTGKLTLDKIFHHSKTGELWRLWDWFDQAVKILGIDEDADTGILNTPVNKEKLMQCIHDYDTGAGLKGADIAELQQLRNDTLAAMAEKGANNE